MVLLLAVGFLMLCFQYPLISCSPIYSSLFQQLESNIQQVNVTICSFHWCSSQQMLQPSRKFVRLIKKIPPQGKACDPQTCHENAKKDFTAGGARWPDHSSCYVQGHCVAGGCQRIVSVLYNVFFLIQCALYKMRPSISSTSRPCLDYKFL